MKEIGSKISIIIILLAMVFLASTFFDTTNSSIVRNTEDNDTPKTYEDTLKDKKQRIESLRFDFFSLSDEIYTGLLAQVNFATNILAKNFESLIVSSYESIGVNFAGGYSIATWSCGVDCQNSTIIDAQTGDILVYGLISKHGLSFSPTSNLLVINPKEQIPVAAGTSSAVATDYYVLTEEKELKLIAKEVAGEELIANCIHATTTARNFLTNEVSVFETPCHVPFGWENISN